jgi:hypothetical protein
MSGFGLALRRLSLGLSVASLACLIISTGCVLVQQVTEPNTSDRRHDER